MSWSNFVGVLTVRPLTTRLPELTYHGSTTGPFSAPWSSTVKLLASEVKHLQPREVLLEADFEERHLRLDGFPRSSASPRSQGVVLTLVGTPLGDLRYPCSTYWDWQARRDRPAAAEDPVAWAEHVRLHRLVQMGRLLTSLGPAQAE